MVVRELCPVGGGGGAFYVSEKRRVMSGSVLSGGGGRSARGKFGLGGVFCSTL